MSKWIKFFIGTPKRALVSIIFVAAIILLDKAGLAAPMIDRLMQETIGRFMGPVVTIVILIVIFRTILGGRK